MNTKHDTDILSLKCIGDTFVQGICITDQNGIIQYVNEANEKIFHISSDDAIGHSITEFTTGVEPLIQNASSLKGVESKGVYHSICTVKSTQKNTLQYAAPIYDSENKIIGFLITDQDISKFLLTKKLLEQSDSKLIVRT